MTKTERVTHELRDPETSEVVATVEDWGRGPCAYRYRGGDWHHLKTAEWSMHRFIARTIEYMGKTPTRERRVYCLRAIRETSWALASWATQTNWTEVPAVETADAGG